MDLHHTARTVQEKYADLLRGFEEVLRRHNLTDLTVSSVVFTATDAASVQLRTSNCPPGTSPKQVCVTRPGGVIHCYTTCE